MIERRLPEETAALTRDALVQAVKLLAPAARENIGHMMPRSSFTDSPMRRTSLEDPLTSSAKPSGPITVPGPISGVTKPSFTSESYA